MTNYYKCEDCGRQITEQTFDKIMEENDGNEPPCKECGGTFVKMGAWADEEESEEEEEEEEDDDYFICERCGKRCKSDEQEHPNGDCDECGDDPLCDNCLVMLEEVSVCKKCIDKVYPRRVETKVEYKERVVEKPVYIDSSKKESEREIVERVSGVKKEQPSFLSKSRFD